MEELKILSEVLTSLMECGYVNNFETLESFIFFSNENGLQELHPNDFRIDSIHCCQDDIDSNELVYVFAVSAAKFDVKGVCIAMEGHSSTAFHSFGKKIWEGFKASILSFYSLN